MSTLVVRPNWAWRKTRPVDVEARGIPMGAVVQHPDGQYPGRVCSCYVAWVDDQGEDWFPLVSLKPLTLVGTIECGKCGATGQVSDGKWVDA